MKFLVETWSCDMSVSIKSAPIVFYKNWLLWYKCANLRNTLDPLDQQKI